MDNMILENDLMVNSLQIRITLSDGVSSVVSMITDKIDKLMVSVDY